MIRAIKVFAAGSWDRAKEADRIMNSRSLEDGLTQSIAGLVILLLILAVIAGAWLSIRAANQVARGLAADGSNK